MESELLLVEFNLELGAVLVAADFGIACARHIVHHTLTQLLCVTGCLVEVVTVDFDTERVVAAATHTAAAGDLEVDQFGIFVEATAQILLHIKDGAFAVVLLGCAHIDADFVVGGAVEEGRHTSVVVRTGRGGDNDNVVTKDIFDVGFHSTSGLEGFFNTCTTLQFSIYRYTPAVLLFHKVHTDFASDKRYQRNDEEGKGDEERDAFMLEAPTQNVGIYCVDCVEGTSDGLVKRELLGGLLALGLFAGCTGQIERLLF